MSAGTDPALSQIEALSAAKSLLFRRFAVC
jgi:hypothetical protein